MMFSATLSKEIRPVCRKFMQDVSRTVAKTSVQQLWPSWVLGPKLTLLYDTLAALMAQQCWETLMAQQCWETAEPSLPPLSCQIGS